MALITSNTVKGTKMPENIRYTDATLSGANHPNPEYDPGDPNAVSPGSTAKEAIWLDVDGNVVGVTTEEGAKIPQNALRKVSRYEYNQLVSIGSAKAMEPAESEATTEPEGTPAEEPTKAKGKEK